MAVAARISASQKKIDLDEVSTGREAGQMVQSIAKSGKENKPRKIGAGSKKKTKKKFRFLKYKSIKMTFAKKDGWTISRNTDISGDQGNLSFEIKSTRSAFRLDEIDRVWAQLFVSLTLARI